MLLFVSCGCAVLLVRRGEETRSFEIPCGISRGAIAHRVNDINDSTIASAVQACLVFQIGSFFVFFPCCVVTFPSVIWE